MAMPGIAMVSVGKSELADMQKTTDQVRKKAGILTSSRMLCGKLPDVLLLREFRKDKSWLASFSSGGTKRMFNVSFFNILCSAPLRVAAGRNRALADWRRLVPQSSAHSTLTCRHDRHGPCSTPNSSCIIFVMMNV
mmetsp:Transcript_76477/g.177482  ORF Transcript_76477/g.177482 Transcript_76477/m.177482 type:complete len:136 (-) Transcript_76477:12-419(-)